MATPVTSAKPPPSPPPASAAEEANKSLSEIKAGRDPLRPARYISKFIGGTVSHGLNGLATWGRRGLWGGAGLGIIAAIATPPGLAAFAVCAAVGFLAGAVIGGVTGLVSGGMKEVNRQRRGEKYADDLIERDRLQKNAPKRTVDYRAYHRENQLHSNYVQEQILQRENDIRHDTYWQDRTAHSHNNAGRGF
ncbi:MAG: hypothetical protein V4735_02815 [Pseudomonadota bacterium]